MKKYIFILLATVLAWTSCNDDFLEKYPVESLTEATAFSTYGNFKTYAWSLYGVFNNANIFFLYASTPGWLKGFIPSRYPLIPHAFSKK